MPVLFDLVQPDNAINTDNERIPSKKAAEATILGITKSLLSKFSGLPSVVKITILVIAKTDIRKQAAAIVVTFKILLEILSSVLVTNRFAITAIENPLNNELITIN